MSGTWDQPIKDRIPLIVSRYVCSCDKGWSWSKPVTSWSSDSSPSSVYKSSGGRSDKSLPTSETELTELSLLALCKTGEPVSWSSEGKGRSVEDGRLDWGRCLLVDLLTADEPVLGSVEVGRIDCALLIGWCFAAEEPVAGSSVNEVCWLDLALLVGWCFTAEKPVPGRMESVVGRLISVWLVGWCFSAEKPVPVKSELAGTGWTGLMKGSVVWTAEAGGEWVRVTFTADENVGSIDLANKMASNLLNLSDHFSSSCAIHRWTSSSRFNSLRCRSFLFLCFFLRGGDSRWRFHSTLFINSP